MKNSKMTDDWINRAVAANPITALDGGMFRMGLARLHFVNLFKPAPPRKGDKDAATKTPQFGCTVLFPPQAAAGIQNILWPAAYALMKEKFPQNIHPETGQPFGLQAVFRDQVEKAATLTGFTPGCMFTNMTSQYKPSIVDTAMNPIVDEGRAYNGVWAILVGNLYSYSNINKGVKFGLQTVMLFADDEKLQAAGVDVHKAFAGVDTSAAFSPAAQFGAPAMGAPSMMPAAQPVAPGYGAPPPGFTPAPAAPIAPGYGAPPPAYPPAYAPPPPPPAAGGYEGDGSELI